MSRPRTYIPDPGSAARNERDRELFVQFVAGNQGAFQKLYNLYERPLILYCEYLLRTPEEAQDVFQEAWLRVVRLRDRDVTIDNFRAMLFTIARNISLTRLAHLKQSSTMKVSLDLIGTEGAWMASKGEQYNELEDLVNRALKRLPLLQREAFVFHAVLGYTFQEIAEMQGSSMTAAKTRAFRARAYLRKLVSNWLGLAEDDPIDDESHRVIYSPIHTSDRK
jgi:RNA polymerase sigma-70 factor (ECF subfamily)